VLYYEVGAEPIEWNEWEWYDRMIVTKYEGPSVFIKRISYRRLLYAFLGSLYVNRVACASNGCQSVVLTRVYSRRYLSMMILYYFVLTCKTLLERLSRYPMGF
jgi:hypothetical protein